MKTNLTWILSLAFLMGLTHSGVSQAKGREGGFGRGGALREVMKSLNLTEEQKNKIKEIRKNGKEANKQTQAALKEGRQALKDLMTGDGKKEEILAKFDSLESQRNKMSRARFEMMLAVREVLTPDQRKQFRSFLEKQAGAFKRFRQHEPGEEAED